MKKKTQNKQNPFYPKQNMKPNLKRCPVKRAAFHRIGSRKQ